MKRSVFLLGAMAMLVATIFGTAVSAQQSNPGNAATPSNVFQIVDDINIQLAAFHFANGSAPKLDKNAPALNTRLPRHVYQKAREVFEKVQLLRTVNGLAANPMPPFPTGEVVPADVLAISLTILAEVQAMRDIYSAGGNLAPAPLASGKTPTDVYANLELAGLQIDGLGIPNVVPNDVYRIALAIIGDLEMIRSARGEIQPIALLAGSSRKKPKAVFEAGLDLMVAIQSLSEGDSALAPPGGVILLNGRSGKIRPGHVLDLLANAMAEISALKVVLGITAPTAWPAVQSGKSPSDVFDAVSTAIQIVRSLNTST